jgi:hypothetical protein
MRPEPPGHILKFYAVIRHGLSSARYPLQGRTLVLNRQKLIHTPLQFSLQVLQPPDPKRARKTFERSEVLTEKNTRVHHPHSVRRKAGGKGGTNVYFLLIPHTPHNAPGIIMGHLSMVLLVPAQPRFLHLVRAVSDPYKYCFL